MKHWKVAPLVEPFDDYLSLAGESLHFFEKSVWTKYVKRIGAENLRGVFDENGKLAGGLAFYRMGQWYGGNNVHCAGLSGVAIDPAERGSGACRTLLQAWLKELYDEGYPIASLYASTQHLYRSVGFEHSGHRLDYSLPMASLLPNKVSAKLPVTRIASPMNSSPGDGSDLSSTDFDGQRHIELLAKISGPRNTSNNGVLERTDGLWERVIEPIGRTTSTYIIGAMDQPEGYLILHHNSRSGGHPHPLSASDWVANTPEAMQQMIRLILSHRSMCDTFNWTGGPQDPLLLMAEEERVIPQAQIRTLNRIVDIKKALESRGYPIGIHGKLTFQIEDSLLTNNAGVWELDVSAGKARVQKIEDSKGSESNLRLNIQALVPLYTSLMTCTQLVDLDQIGCSDSKLIGLADLVFSGPAPWTCEMF